MAVIEINWNPTNRELKQFSYLCLGIGLLLGFWFRFGHGWPWTASIIVWCILGTIGLLGMISPSLVRPIWVGWTCAVFPIGWVISHLLLGIVYYLVLTPIGLIMRACGRDPMQREFDASTSYWEPHTPSNEPARYFRQF